jgi:uncharacterized membrane protein
LKKYKAIGIAEQALLVLNMIILFLLMFEDRLVIPYWLQPAGRMHPLLLHFPIAFLTLSVVVAIYRSDRDDAQNPAFKQIERGLLLTGTLLTGITLIMGLFLSREGTYAGDTLTWHKWSGVAVFFLASALYAVVFRKWFSASAAWASGLLMMAGLIATGHYGAALSHGEGFLTEPITAHRSPKIVPLEQAVVYADVIQPILDMKCAGCHNTNKLKGELVLTDSVSLHKGGKSGRLFVPGNPDTSLMIERIHLAMEEEKHMPPAGKPQLTKEETALLAAWVSAGANFHAKVTGLSNEDTLRLMATAWLQRTSVAAEPYDFAAADPKTIQKLNTDYRTILTIAKGSPALEVNLYNRNTYSSAQLKELETIRKQIVSLNLNKLPVKDEDLKLIGGFENIRSLNLNFSDITDKGLEALKPLKNLRSLSLSGTAVTYKGLVSIHPAFKDLSSVTLWQTAMTPEEMDRLKKDHKAITINEGFHDDGKNMLKLNPPQIGNATTVFTNDIPVLLRHPVRGVQIRFTTDGSEPDSIHPALFDGKTTIDRTTTVKAKAFKDGWYFSDVVMFDFLKNARVPDSVRLLLPLNSVHLAEGANTFFNKRLGAIGANNPAWANNWAGVQKNDLVLVALFNKPVTLSSLGVHYMVEEKTGIYPPGLVEVWGGENEQQARLLATLRPPMPTKGSEPYLKLVQGSFPPRSIGYLKIIAKPHREKKNQHLLLVDEMLLN